MSGVSKQAGFPEVVGCPDTDTNDRNQSDEEGPKFGRRGSVQPLTKGSRDSRPRPLGATPIHTAIVCPAAGLFRDRLTACSYDGIL